MNERQFFDQANGIFYSFILRHPRSITPELIIQPPEGHVGKQAPTFDANAVAKYLIWSLGDLPLGELDEDES